MISSELQHLVVFAITTRILLFGFQILANFFIPNHEADAFRPDNVLSLGPMSEIFFGGLSRWDAQHFLFISKYGYVLETSLAFFPLLPIFARLISGSLLVLLAPLFTQDALLLLAMVALNLYCFVQSAVLHYRFARDMLKSHQLSLLVAMLFCINPASIFMTAAYTESLFHMLTMFGLVYLRSGRPFLGALCFSLSAACRSNGMINVLYLILYVVNTNYLKLVEVLEPKKGTSLIKRLFSASWTIIDSLSTFGFLTAACIAPYFIFQYYAYSVHCSKNFAITPSQNVVAFARANDLKLLSDEPVSEWCHETVPLAYSYLQKHYWNVGFLSYFEIKQIPNFLLASPVIVMATSCLFVEFREFYIRIIASWQSGSLRQLAMSYSSVWMLLMSFHMAFILIFGVFVANVQIVTRLLFSSGPLLYWYAARIILTDAISVPELKAVFLDQQHPDSQHQKLKRDEDGFMHSIWNNPLLLVIAHWHLLSLRTRLILLYFLTYFFVGTALFCNFYPWT